MFVLLAPCMGVEDFLERGEGWQINIGALVRTVAMVKSLHTLKGTLIPHRKKNPTAERPFRVEQTARSAP